MFDTKMRHKHKENSGTSIMSGEIHQINKQVRRTFDPFKIPYAGSSIDISQPDVYRYEVDKTLSRNNPMFQSYNTYRKPENNLEEATLAPKQPLNQSLNKSRNSTFDKRVNSMERILEWQPKGLHKLNLINEKKNIFMEKSLKNIIPYRENSIGKL